ncbi:MAG: glycoside hydrolase family 27 protein [Gemmatimonadaceae bacterium]
MSIAKTNRRDFLRSGLAGSAALLAGCARSRAPIDGTWKLIIGQLDNGDDLTIHYELSQVGKKLTGRTMHIAAYGYSKIEDGTIDGDHFSFTDGFFKVRGDVSGDTLRIQADYDRSWPYTNVLDPSMTKVPMGWKGTFRQFVMHRVPAGSGIFPSGGPLPALTDLPANGLALTPPMIWGAWYGFTTTITDALMREMGRAMVSTGLRDAGYNILNMEVGWTGQRDAQGNLQSNAKFPDMKALGDYLHSLGLKMGICTSPGPYDCIGYAGSLGHEEQDAKTWASWGVDFIKHDACSVREVHPHDSRLVYQKMGSALQQCGRPIIYALCQYGDEDVWTWGTKVGGNMWRTTGDMSDNWKSISAAFDQGRLAPYAGPGHWNDPDYLMVGMGHSSLEEYRTQMSLWCMLAAPLINSVDLRSMSADSRAILLNKELIAIDQDSRGVQGQRASASGSTEIWLKPLADGHAVALFNRGETDAAIELDTAKLGLSGVREARDLWAGKDVALKDGRYRASIPRHGSVVLRLPGQS